MYVLSYMTQTLILFDVDGTLTPLDLQYLITC